LPMWGVPRGGGGAPGGSPPPARFSGDADAPVPTN